MNQFMLMMMAQLKNQNPMDPQNTDNMLGQVAQLNSLSQLQDLNAKLQELISASQIGYASSLVGKTVTAKIANQDPIQGVVKSVSNESGNWMVNIGNQSLPLTDVIAVQEEAKA